MPLAFSGSFTASFKTPGRCMQWGGNALLSLVFLAALFVVAPIISRNIAVKAIEVTAVASRYCLCSPKWWSWHSVKLKLSVIQGDALQSRVIRVDIEWGHPVYPLAVNLMRRRRHRRLYIWKHCVWLPFEWKRLWDVFPVLKKIPTALS